MQTIINHTHNNIAQDLKKQTQSLHHQIEQNYYTKAIVEESITLSDYIVLLEKFLGYYVPIEQQMLKFTEWAKYNFDILARKKTGWLIEDLKSLGKSHQAIEQIVFCENLPKMDSFANCLGVLYVLEGSTLGGQILKKHLKNSLNLDEQNGARFYVGYPSHTVGPKWIEFQQLLTDFEKHNPNKRLDVIDSAIDTFATLDNWLKQETKNLHSSKN